MSTQEQAKEGYSIEHQVKKLKGYFELYSLNNIKIFADEGYSARDLNRPKLQELIHLIKQNEIKRVATLTVDRMSRNMLDMLNFIEMCEEHETSFSCPSINFDTSTPVGRMVLYILSAFAEFQRRMIAENVKSNMDNIVQDRGNYLTLPPFGYKINEKTGKLEIVETEAYWIKKMAEKFISGSSYRSIASWLNDNKVKTRRGKLWSAVAVKNLLTNDIYRGKTTWNRRYYDKKGKLRWRSKEDWIIKENTHQPIIEPFTWNEILKRCQEVKKGQIKTMSNLPPVPPGENYSTSHWQKYKYKLSGLMYCAHCTSKMTSRKYSSRGPNKDKRIFVCSNYQKKGLCKFNYIFMDEAEKNTLGLLNKLLSKSKLPGFENLDSKPTNIIDYIIQKNIDELIHLQKNAYNHQKTLLKEKFQRHIKAYENGIITMEDLEKARQRLDINKRSIEEKFLDTKFLNSQLDNRLIMRILRTVFYSIEVEDGRIIRWKLSPTITSKSKQ